MEGDGVRVKSRASGASPGTALRSGRGGVSPGHGEPEFVVEAGGGGGDDTEAPREGAEATGEENQRLRAVYKAASTVVRAMSLFSLSSASPALGRTTYLNVL